MKAVFLDRDGVITNNSSLYYIFRKEDVTFVDGIFENLHLLCKLGYELFIVTNQGGIAKKQYTMVEVEAVHQYIKDEFSKFGISFRDIQICPHHDETGKCLCRKPSPLMIEKLIARYGIDKAQSFFIGDSETDMQAAQSAGVTGIKIEANKNMRPFILQILPV